MSEVDRLPTQGPKAKNMLHVRK